MALAGLESCFRVVPPEVVASVVDCVLASSSFSPPRPPSSSAPSSSPSRRCRTKVTAMSPPSPTPRRSAICSPASATPGTRDALRAAHEGLPAAPPSGGLRVGLALGQGSRGDGPGPSQTRGPDPAHIKGYSHIT